MTTSVGKVALDVVPAVAGLSAKIKAAASEAASEASASTRIVPQVDGEGAGKRFSSGFLAQARQAAVAVGALFAAKEVVDFGKESIAAFTETATAATRLQRAIGGTVEDASRLNFAAHESGVSQQSLANSLKLLERNITSVGGKTPAGAKALQQLGVEADDASGKVKPMTELLPELAEKFAAMPNGAEKSALAMKLFGRSGLDMLPFLNKGKEGIADLLAESDKFGLTIGTKQTDAVKANIVAQRQWNAALEGVKVQVGSQLLPVITGMTNYFRASVMPTILSVTSFLMKHADAVKQVATVVGVFVVGLVAYQAVTKAVSFAMEVWSNVTKAFTVVQAALNLVLDANPIGLVIIAIGALVAAVIIAYQRSETFRNIVQAAWRGIQTAVSTAWNGVIKPAVQAMVDFWNNVLGPAMTWLYDTVIKPIWAAISFYIGSEIAIVRGILTAAMQIIHGDWSGAWNTISTVVSNIWAPIGAAISAGLGTVEGYFSGLPGRILGKLGDLGSLLLGAGQRLIEGLISGITSKIADVTNAIGSVVSVIKDHLPGSPIKTGPLLSWNNGGAGKRLMGTLIDGMVSSKGAVGSAAAVAVSGIAAASLRAGSGGLATGRTSGGMAMNFYGPMGADPHDVAALLAERQRQAQVVYGLGLVAP